MESLVVRLVSVNPMSTANLKQCELLYFILFCLWLRNLTSHATKVNARAKFRIIRKVTLTLQQLPQQAWSVQCASSQTWLRILLALFFSNQTLHRHRDWAYGIESGALSVVKVTWHMVQYAQNSRLCLCVVKMLLAEIVKLFVHL